MALEQQHNPIRDKTAQVTRAGANPRCASASRPDQTAVDGSMWVSYYHIPDMHGAVQEQRVRQALIPFSELLIEHCIDVNARHLALYHQAPIDSVTVALQRLNLGASLQQTMPHYEPVELATAQKPSQTREQGSVEKKAVHPIWRFLSQLVARVKQWLKNLQKQQGR